MKNSIVLILAAALAIAGFAAGDANVSVACDSAKTTAVKAGACCASNAAALAAADCEKACAEAAATVTAGKNACCKAAVAAAMKACSMSAGACAGAKGSATTAGIGSRSKSTTTTAGLSACCKETVAAYHAAVAKYINAKAPVAWTSSSCTRSAVAGSGCTRSAVAGSGCKHATSAASVAGAGNVCTQGATAALSYAEVKAREGKRMVLTGNPACAKCTFKASETCEALFQTADGQVYRVLNNEKYNKMRETEADKGFEITTRVRKLDGVTYLEIETLKAL